MDAGSKKIKIKILTDGILGKLPVASEVSNNGELYPWEAQALAKRMLDQAPNGDRFKPTLYGIESPNVHGLIEVAIYREELIMALASSQTTVTDLLIAILRNPLVSTAFDQLNQYDKPAEYELFQGSSILAGWIRKARKDLGSPLDAGRIMEYISKHPVPHVPDESGFDFAETMYNKVRDNFSQTFSKQIDIKKLYQVSSPQELIVRTADLRNIDFMQSVSNLICQYRGSEKPLIVLVGEAHVKPMQQLLNRLSGNSIQTESYQSKDPVDSERLLKRLAQ